MINPKAQPNVHTAQAAEERSFLGFAPPTSNTTYTPNQFFDVCLPHYSRGCVRLVGYMLRRTLGWCDAAGNPQEDQLVISYADLVENANISRGAIGPVLDEAIRANFIRCVRKPRSKSPGLSAVTGLYELRWHDSGSYIKDPAHFRGFYEGDGNRTDIPNEFFDVCVKHESLAVIKVVGSIIRFSIGFQARRGARRQHVELSYNDIQRYANISVRRHLADAIQRAIEQNYIVRVQQGLFTSDKSYQTATTYAVKWLDAMPYPFIGSKKTPDLNTPIGSKKTPEDRFKKDTTIKIKHTNETLKQQQNPAAAEQREAFLILKNQGFSDQDATHLAEHFPLSTIKNQTAWLPLRKPALNPLGLLRRAIEQNWPMPPTTVTPDSDPSHGATFAAYFYAGKAGNDGLPVALPSTAEASLCDAFVSELLAIWPDQTKITEWGRDFGRYVAQETAGKKDFTVTLVYAVRNYGDQFLTRVRAKRSRLLEESRKRARHDHRRAYSSLFRAYVLAEEKRIAAEHPDAYAEFQATRAAARRHIEANPWVTDEAQRTKMLNDFDSDRQRLTDFLQHFNGQVLTFWEWDSQLNPNPFNGAQVAV